MYEATVVVSLRASAEDGAESETLMAATKKDRNGNTAAAVRIRGFRLVRWRIPVMKGRFE